MCVLLLHLQARGTCDPKIIVYGDNNFDKLRKLVHTLPEEAALAAKIDAAQGFLKHEYRAHVNGGLEAPGSLAAACATHNPVYALLGGVTPPTAAAAPVPKAPRSLPKKWALKWPPGLAPEGPPPTACAGCNIVHELYEDVAAALGEELEPGSNLILGGTPRTADEAAAKVAKCKERTTVYMGHLMRCCVQQHYIKQLIASVVANATHIHVVFDYKVSVSACARFCAV